MTLADDLIASNPFPGLRPFETREADRFFGREQQIAELVALLDAVSLVAVSGSSGCGKSSLVRAGLLSALSAGAFGPAWRHVVTRPGNSPITNLARELSAALRTGAGAPDRTAIPESAASLPAALAVEVGIDDSVAGPLYGRLRLGGLGLLEAVGLAHIEPNTRVLVVVDQFEEIFRFQPIDPEEASAFVKLLLHATADPASPVRVVLTMRSDSLGSCADFRGLAEAVSRGQYLVPRLTRAQRKEAIVKPVERLGFAVAPRLVQRLLNDASDSFDDLPLMQHALTRTWNHWATVTHGQRPIDLEDYRAVGTTADALSNQGAEALASLPGLELVTEKVFRAVTEPIVDAPDARRPMTFDRLCEVVGGVPEDVAAVVNRYRRPDTAFLMPPSDVPLASNPVIDISHESLIRQWDRLRGWAAAEADARVTLSRLIEAARGYASGQGSLWRGPELQKSLAWRARTAPTPAWVALYATGADGAETWKSIQTFLDGSAREVRRGRLQWRLTIALACVLALTVFGVGAFAVSDARHRQQRTMSRELTNRALLEVDPARSAHFALAAMNQDEDNSRAEYALRQALATLDVAHTRRILSLGAAVSDVRYTHDGTRLVAASGNKVYVFDSQTFEPIGKPVSRDNIVGSAWLVANNTTLVTYTADGTAQIQRLGDEKLQPIGCEGEKNAAYKAVVSPDERFVALACWDGDIPVWDITHADAREPRLGFKDGTDVTALAFSADGAYLASGTSTGIVTIWKRERSKPLIGKSSLDSPIRHELAVRDIDFDASDPKLLVTAGDDGKAIVWSLDLKGARLSPEKGNHWVLKHERPVTVSKFLPGRNERPVLTISDKTARVWINEEDKQVRGHDDWVNDAASSADGELLVTASSDSTARVWSTRSGAPIAVLRGHQDDVTRAIMSPDGTQVVTASSDGTVRIWRLRVPKMLVAGSGWMLGAAFAPNGQDIAVGGEARAAIVKLSDVSGSAPPPSKDLSSSISNVHSFLSWSREGQYVLDVRYQPGYAEFNSARISLWDARNGREVGPAWLTNCRSASFSAGSDELVVVDRLGQIAVWDATDPAGAAGRSPKIPAFGKNYVRASISPDGNWIVAIQGDYTATLWRRQGADVSEPRVLEGHRGQIRAMQFSDDSKWLVTASADRTARIWPVSGVGTPTVLSGGHTASLSSAAFNHDASRVVTGSADGTIRVWDRKTGNELVVLRRHAEGVNEVQFSRDGQWILSASDDGSVQLGQCEACNMSIGELQDRVKQDAQLPDEELKAIAGEVELKMPFARLFSLTSRAH